MDPESARRLQSAAERFSAGRLDDAERLARDVVNSYPGATDAVHLLALICRRKGDATESQSLFLTCIEQAPARADIRANYGNLLGALGQSAEAIDTYREALEQDASFRPARLALARSLISAGAFEDAAAEAQTLVDTDPDDARAWVTLARALRGLERFDDAEAAYRKALEIDPAYGVAHHNLGSLLAKLSRSEEALESLDRAEAAGTHGPELDYNRSSALAGLYRFDEAEGILVGTIRSSPLAIDAHRLLARLRFMRGDENYAAELRAAAAGAPAFVPLQLAYAQILNAAGAFADAETVLTAALAHNVGNPQLLAELASVQQETGRYADALRSAEGALALMPEERHLADLKIDALLSLGRADEAMPLIESARRAAPLDQGYVALEATAARLIGDPRYEELYDYERLIRSFDLEPPTGWSSIAEFHDDLIPALVERHRFHAHPLDQSLRFGTQTPRGLLGDPDPVIKAFVAALAGPLERYRRAIGAADGHVMTGRNEGPIELTGCWSVRLRQGGYHVNHVHPEGWVSSAYYAEVPPEVGDENERSGWIKFGEPRFPVPGVTPEKYVQPVPGRLVLFPSYMWHGTTPIHGDEPRMTIAFDAVCRG